MTIILGNTILSIFKVLLTLFLVIHASYSNAFSKQTIEELQQIYSTSEGAEKAEVSLQLAERVNEITTENPLTEFNEYLMSATSASESTGNDSLHINILFRAGQLAWRNGVIGTAISFYDDAIDLSKKVDSDQLAEVAFYYGVIYFEQAELPKAIEKLDLCLAEARQRNLLQMLPRCSNLLGNIYNRLGQPSKAIPLLSRALEIETKTQNIRALAAITNNLGLSYSKTGEPDKAIDYYLQSFDLELKQGNLDGKIISLMNIATIYFSDLRDIDAGFNYIRRAISLAESNQVTESLPILYINIANFYQDELRFEEAEAMYLKALQIAEDVKDRQSKVRAYIGLGHKAFRNKQLNEALEHYKSALESATEIQSKEEIVVANIGIAEALILTDRANEAIAYAKEAAIEAKLHKLGDHESDATLVTSNAYAKINDFQNAYQYLKLHTEFITQKSEKLLKEDIAKVKAKYEIEKRKANTSIRNNKEKIKNLESIVNTKVKTGIYAFWIVFGLIFILLINRNLTRY